MVASSNLVVPTSLAEALAKASSFYCFATVAQLVEQRIRNAWVSGSSPLGGSTASEKRIEKSEG